MVASTMSRRTSLPKCCAGSGILHRNQQGRTEECKNYMLQLRLLQILQPVARAISFKHRR